MRSIPVHFNLFFVEDIIFCLFKISIINLKLIILTNNFKTGFEAILNFHYIHIIKTRVTRLLKCNRI